LNIPVYAFYYSGNSSIEENLNVSGNIRGSFAKLSLGNIGQSQNSDG